MDATGRAYAERAIHNPHQIPTPRRLEAGGRWWSGRTPTNPTPTRGDHQVVHQIDGNGYTCALDLEEADADEASGGR